MPLWTRLGLRARVTVMFALGALVLSVSMGALSYFTTRHFLVGERESADIQDAFVSATYVSQHIGPTADVDQILTTASKITADTHSLLEQRGTWSSGTLQVTQGALPASLRAMVIKDGTAASQNYTLHGTPQIAVGVPIKSVGAYFQIFDVGDLGHTLNVLALAVFVAGIVTTALGAALGRWASGRSLRPLTGVSRAAVAIAGGQLDTRLVSMAGDPDLAALTSSFNRMVDQLQERIEREARFTSDVSHELRSPLTTLAASLEVLETQVDSLTPPARRALELLSADVRRFKRMVGDLLEISRSDSGSAEVSLEEVDPGELVERAVAAAQKSLPIHTPPPPVDVDPAVHGTHLWVDKRRFERVMSNLLENATLYGGGATAVRVALANGERDGSEGPDHAVRVSVEDAGPGLPPTERTRVFERFYRGHAAYERGAGTGTGLGLALVAEHVRLHGGKVWADEAQGGGARFTIELPGRLAEPDDEELAGTDGAS
ncbi:MAG TPA: HAMP domain-containing sensor histidine kinase [Acidimicrobiales bacterium]|nr:HAMP domain-containing sensor histidine kinase [Acidimicrobiales bacterium]